MLGGKLVERLFRQVVGFVDAVKTVFRRRQNHAAAHIDVHHQQIVVGHHHIGVFQRVARQVKRTFGTVWAGGFQAAVVVVAHFLPQRIVDFVRPLVAVAVKFAAGKTLGDVVQQRQIFRLRFFVPQHRRCFKAGQALLGVVLRQLVEPVGAEIAAAPLGQREAQFQPAVGHHKGQITADQLLLQGDGGAGHHQPLAARLRHNAAGQQIGQRLADAGRPLHHHNALALATGRLAVFRLPCPALGSQSARKSVGHRRNHLALGGARTEVGQVVGQRAVVVADGVFFEFGEHGKVFQAACNGGTDIARPGGRARILVQAPAACWDFWPPCRQPESPAGSLKLSGCLLLWQKRRPACFSRCKSAVRPYNPQRAASRFFTTDRRHLWQSVCKKAATSA